MGITLDQAIAQADLPGLVGQYYPETGARPGKGGLYRAVWRGEKHPSFSIYRHNGIWFFRDHATGEKGTAWHFLTEIAGLSEREALAVLGVQGSGGTGPASWREVLAEAQERLRRLGKVPKELEGRGFTFEDLLALEVGVSKEGAVLPIRDPKGRVVAAKVRRLRVPKYRYLEEGMRAQAWYPPGFSATKPVLVVEGELNAAIAWRVFPQVDPVGVAGAENSPDWEALRGRKVFLAADADEAGKRALVRWEEEALKAGVFPLALPPLERDFCEIAGESREALALLLQGLTRPLYTEAVGLAEDLEALRARVGRALLKERTEPVGEVQGRTVYRYQAWLEPPPYPLGVLAW
ncbi:hypothetical protein [Fervidobacterium sp.]